jgi:arylformamidase
MPMHLYPSPTATEPALWDISAPLFEGMPHWPADTPFSQHLSWPMQLEEAATLCPVNVSRLVMSAHAGTHADAPWHTEPQGACIGSVQLDAYLGPCRVVDARSAKQLVRLSDIHAGLREPLPPRVLLRTCLQAATQVWDPDFCALDADLVHHLHHLGVVLVGIDTPSIDPMNSHSMDAHHAAQAHHMAILESVVLDHVPVGDYELIALPLKLMQGDASPVRAVLRSLPSPFSSPPA